MPKAIVMTEPGGPEVLHLHDIDPGAPGPGELRVRHTALGYRCAKVDFPVPASTCHLGARPRYPRKAVIGMHRILSSLTGNQELSCARS